MIPMSDAVIGADMNVVTATRNAVDIRKWVASKLLSNQYGDQPSVSIHNSTNVLVISEEKQRELQALRQKLITSANGSNLKQ